ncbi:MAG: NAD(P)/FAD-dependent oxidoreductase [Candidatus Methanofastidiosa archaeon]|nr:NAD(P)/FAD-dependent oxidoreductase [Candidatus Methanofastidiosa archaeon]
MNITVIGAGPSGLLASQYLTRAGYNVNIIEEHKNIGRPIACSGLIGSDYFKHFKEFNVSDSIKNRIDGARVYFGKDSFDLKRKGVSYVVDRELFDKSLSNGLEVSLAEKYISFYRKEKYISIKTDKRMIKSDLLIGADGPASKVRNQGFNFKLKHYKGYQVRVKADLDLDNFVEVHIQRPFFTWIIPETEGIFRIGTVSENPKETLSNFLKEKQIKEVPLEVQAGIIPIGSGEIYRDRVFLLGDAACQVKPLSGGGVYYGALAAECLANSIVSDNYYNYCKECNQLIGKEISKGLLFRKIYENLSEDEIKSVFDYIKSKKQILDEQGSFDQHYKTIVSLIKDPRIVKFLPLIIKSFHRIF